MCLTPVKLSVLTGEYDPNGPEKVACGQCRRCRDNRVNDFVGRCLAEKCTADAAFAVTLTYKGDGPETALLRYSDVQKFMKRLRKDGYNVRYICAGEYGTKKGRAHWHCILFFYGKVPNVPIKSNVDWEYWPHGFSFFQQPEFYGFKYILKYVFKDAKVPGAIGALSMSKKPPLGHEYFMQLADKLAVNKLPIRDPSYSFIDDGKTRSFWIRGRMRELFFDRYLEEWQRLYDTPPLICDVMEKYLDRVAREEAEADGFYRMSDMKQARYLHSGGVQVPQKKYTGRSCVSAMIIDREKMLWAYVFDDGILEIDREEEKRWLITVNDKSVSAEEQLWRCGFKLLLISQLVKWAREKLRL